MSGHRNRERVRDIVLDHVVKQFLTKLGHLSHEPNDRKEPAVSRSLSESRLSRTAVPELEGPGDLGGAERSVVDVGPRDVFNKSRNSGENTNRVGFRHRMKTFRAGKMGF